MIAYIIGIVAVVVVTAACVLSGVYLGLKWNVQIRQGEKPTVELPKNPIAAVQERQEEKRVESVLDEWLNGEKEGGADR